MRTTFHRKLAKASSEAEIVELVREYLSTWRPEELAELPPECRPWKSIRDGEDIAEVAIALTRARITRSDSDPGLIEMEAFLARACARISAAAGEMARSSTPR